MEPRDLLGKIDLFKDLSIDQLSAVAPLGGLVSVKAGEELAGEDESTQSLFNIIKGEARLSFQTRTGEISVRDVGPGDSFPLAALLESGSLIRNYTFSAVWEKDSIEDDRKAQTPPTQE